MRVRVLELPTLPDLVDGSYRVPFVLVIDDVRQPWAREVADQFQTYARGLGAEGILVFAERVELEQRDRDDWPHYTSTYCIHDRHADCRLSCKVCSAPCRCSCHDTTPEPAHDPSLVDQQGST